MPKTFSYNKQEKLKSRKLLEEIFSRGKTFSVFPVKVFYLQPAAALDYPVKIGVGAGSRNFKKAVQRNRIKRLLREAYRTEKLVLHDYLQLSGKQVVVFLLYIDKTIPNLNTLQVKIPLVLQRLIKELNETPAANT